MAGKGNTTPKPADQRRRTNRAPKDHAVVADGEQRGPDLPFGYDWAAQTRIWWDNWRRSAQAIDFTATDWDFLLDTAMVHSEFWAGNTSVGPELRLRVAKLGATKGDRDQLRITVTTDGPEESKPKGQRYSHLKVIGE